VRHPSVLYSSPPSFSSFPLSCAAVRRCSFLFCVWAGKGSAPLEKPKGKGKGKGKRVTAASSHPPTHHAT
jgi:hypothetical protein